MNSVKVLDVTLRDGGCVIDFNFGQDYMDQILNGLEKSGVDIIELGYLDSAKGSVQGRTQFCNAGHFYKKHMLPVEQVAELLGLIAEEKKISFDKEYAEQLYLSYNARRHQNDDPAIQELTEAIRGKRVLLVAPGKRLSEGEKTIREMLLDPNVISVSLNSFDRFDTDYVLTTRVDAFQKAQEYGKKIIATSGVCDGSADNVQVIDYEKWITVENGVQDSSGIVALKLMTACGASELLLAGFDGFSTNMNQNYYDKSMRRPVSEEQATQRNSYFRSYVNRLRATVSVTFLTKSLYEE